MYLPDALIAIGVTLGYFAAAYGVTMLAPQGLSTHGEPSAAALGGLIRQARAESIRERGGRVEIMK